MGAEMWALSQAATDSYNRFRNKQIRDIAKALNVPAHLLGGDR